MKRVMILICCLWTVIVFYCLNRPPESPEPFPRTSDDIIPRRTTYNPAWAEAFDQGMRDLWQKPDEVLEVLAPLDGLRVADIGCGEGYFTIPLLAMVGPSGRVYATDIQQELLDRLLQSTPSAYQERLTVIHSQERDLGISSRVDLVLLIQVLGEVEHQREFLGQIQQIMNPNARLVLIDSKHITDQQTGYSRPLSMNRLLSALQDVGFQRIQQYGFLPKQFFLVLRKTTGDANPASAPHMNPAPTVESEPT